MRRLTKKEFLIPAILAMAVILIVGSSQIFTSPTAGTAVYGSPIPGNDLSSKQVLKISQGITGQINSATGFENVTIQIQALTNHFDGYEEQELLNFANNQWTGDWLINIPTNNATSALLGYRDLIQANGEVTTIQIQINNVTNQTSGNQSLVQWSPLSISLQQVQTQQPASPFSGALALLSAIGIDAAYVGLIGIPTYFGALAVFFMTKRGLAPMLFWVSRISKKSVVKTKEMAA